MVRVDFVDGIHSSFNPSGGTARENMQKTGTTHKVVVVNEFYQVKGRVEFLCHKHVMKFHTVATDS